MDCNKRLINDIRNALNEDLGTRDITTEMTAPSDMVSKAVLVVKQDCVVCGLDIAGLALKIKDRNIKFASGIGDGDFIKKGKVIARIQGKTRSILSAERVALNYICLLSGIATKTRQYVEAVKPYKAKITDTRKTIPGLRELEKYAVRTGGGFNHRMRLDEMVLIKDNHLKAMGNWFWASGLDKIRKIISPKVKIEIEVKDLNEFRQALKMRPEMILLDNMDVKDMKNAVRIRNGQGHSAMGVKLEASGGITLDNINKVASCGVDIISVGALTHSVSSVDISLEVL
jgi:nicotinate-nucleotide pyrophosphorylase (carboxylating)